MRRSILYLFIALPFFLPAQPVGTVYATVGYSDAHARLHTSELYVLYWSQHWESFVYGEYIQRSSRAPGVSIGVGYVALPRCEVALRINYAGRTVQDSVHSLDLSSFNLATSNYTDRIYRTIWTEALMFWQINQASSKLKLQVGTGLTYFLLMQNYVSGMECDGSISECEIFVANTRDVQLGIPLHVQLRYPVSKHLQIGGALQYGAYFGRQHAHSALSAFATFYW